MSQEFDRTRAERDIRQAMLCPVDWASVFRVGAPALFEPLEALWRSSLEANVRGSEAAYIGDDYMLAMLSTESDENLRAMCHNVQLWKDDALDQFLKVVYRFTDLRYASRQEYNKHCPPRGPWPGAHWIEEQSRKRGVSIFYFDILEDAALTAFLHGIFWGFGADGADFGMVPEAKKELWRRILGSANTRVCFSCGGPIGASRGYSTNFICFDFDAVTPIVHGYPIAEDQAWQIHDGCPIQRITELEKWELR